jgi:thiol reductant ABC exporter CydC subunit
MATNAPPPAASGAQQPDEPEAPLRATLELARPAAGRLTLATLLGAGAVGAGIGLIATSAWLISRASQRPVEASLTLAIVAVQFFGLSRGLFRYAQRLVSHDVAFRTLADLRMRTYARLEALAPAGLPAFRRGDLLSRIVSDIDSLQDLMLRVIPPFGIALIVGLATVALMYGILPAAGLVMLVALLLAAFALTWVTGRLARSVEAREAVVRGELTAAVVDLLQGGDELRAFGALDAQLQRTAGLDAELGRVAAASARTAGVGQGATTLLSGLAMWGALAVGIAAVHGGTMSGVVLAVIALVPLAAFELLTDLPTATQALRRVRRAAARTLEVVDTPPPVSDPADPAPAPRPPATLRVHGLRVRYGESGPWVLDGLDLELVPGRKLAVVGRSGAGKSTLAEVLLRFLPYQGGSVTLDGVPIDALAGDELRRVVGQVSQDAHVFDTTLEENVRLARREATDDDLRAALRRASLLDWIDLLPNGLKTRVGHNGAEISGGQRQRLAVARALLAGFPMLVADEPGEHLDTATADTLVADLLAGVGDQAVLLITHRLTGLEAVDEVIVLEDGRAVERGTHAELLAAAGVYASMWMRETGAVQRARSGGRSPDQGDAMRSGSNFDELR